MIDEPEKIMAMDSKEFLVDFFEDIIRQYLLVFGFSSWLPTKVHLSYDFFFPDKLEK